MEEIIQLVWSYAIKEILAFSYFVLSFIKDY